MTVREDSGVRISAPDIIVISALRKEAGTPPDMAIRPSVRRRVVLIAAALVAAMGIAAATAAFLVGNDGDTLTPVAEQAADVPPAAEPLVVRADTPTSATVGQPVRISVAYTDGSGIFSGTSEEWGDGVGASSQREGRCTAAAPAPRELSDTYVVTHRWSRPGTYTMTLGVSTYTCRGTTAVQDHATQTVTVHVTG
jgi:hypothetical protein